MLSYQLKSSSGDRTAKYYFSLSFNFPVDLLSSRKVRSCGVASSSRIHSSLFFHFREFCFEFFVRWLGHGVSLGWMDWKQDYTMRFDLAECGLYSARDFT